MDLVNRRSLLGFLLATCLSVIPATCDNSMAQESVSTESSVPPTLLLPWACNWSVTCIGPDGLEFTMSGTEYGVTANRAEIRAENATFDPINRCVPQTPPTMYPKIVVGPAYRTGGFAISEIREPANSCSPACQCTGDGDWVVYFECTGKNGGLVSKSARGRTYCEASANARSYVCRMINSDVFGGSCRCCSRVVERPACSQHCVPPKRR
jgi:hypothetical protein